MKTLVDVAALSPEDARLRSAGIRSKFVAQLAPPPLFPSIGAAGGDGALARLESGHLEQIFTLIDAAVFEGGIARAIQARGAHLGFRVSRRMTRAGGKTRWRTGPRHDAFEIAISEPLLLQSFGEVDRAVHVNGLRCHDRIDAFQRVMEHEILHLVEFLEWGTSSCSAPLFLERASCLFGHTATRHRLVTQSERARVIRGVQRGSRVRFPWKGRWLTGQVRRITRRATVLVPSVTGVPYTDGQRYEKYYVPLERLEVIS